MTFPSDKDEMVAWLKVQFADRKFVRAWEGRFYTAGKEPVEYMKALRGTLWTLIQEGKIELAMLVATGKIWDECVRNRLVFQEEVPEVVCKAVDAFYDYDWGSS